MHFQSSLSSGLITSFHLFFLTLFLHMCLYSKLHHVEIPAMTVRYFCGCYFLCLEWFSRGFILHPLVNSLNVIFSGETFPSYPTELLKLTKSLILWVAIYPFFYHPDVKFFRTENLFYLYMSPEPSTVPKTQTVVGKYWFDQYFSYIHKINEN